VLVVIAKSDCVIDLLGDSELLMSDKSDSSLISRPFRRPLSGATGMRINRALKVMAEKAQKRLLRKQQVSCYVCVDLMHICVVLKRIAMFVSRLVST
jgi:hypothetical protein